MGCEGREVLCGPGRGEMWTCRQGSRGLRKVEQRLGRESRRSTSADHSFIHLFNIPAPAHTRPCAGHRGLRHKSLPGPSSRKKKIWPGLGQKEVQGLGVQGSTHGYTPEPLLEVAERVCWEEGTDVQSQEEWRASSRKTDCSVRQQSVS